MQVKWINNTVDDESSTKIQFFRNYLYSLTTVFPQNNTSRHKYVSVQRGWVPFQRWKNIFRWNFFYERVMRKKEFSFLVGKHQKKFLLKTFSCALSSYFMKFEIN